MHFFGIILSYTAFFILLRHISYFWNLVCHKCISHLQGNENAPAFTHLPQNLPGDLDLWPTTLTYNPNLVKVNANFYTKNQGHGSSGLVGRKPTDRHTHTEKDSSDSITSTADAGVNKVSSIWSREKTQECVTDRGWSMYVQFAVIILGTCRSVSFLHIVSQCAYGAYDSKT